MYAAAQKEFMQFRQKITELLVSEYDKNTDFKFAKDSRVKIAYEHNFPVGAKNASYEAFFHVKTCQLQRPRAHLKYTVYDFWWYILKISVYCYILTPKSMDHLPFLSFWVY